MDAVTLYDTNKVNKIKVWSIRVTPDATIETTYGQLEGKQTTNRKKLSVGKNIGKTNETTPLQQAIAEAKATITLKIRSGYNKENESENEQKSSNDQKDTPALLLPMLLNDYNKCSKHITFPCYTQPKIDGVRAIYQNGQFHSRGGKSFSGLEHIVDSIPSSVTDVLDGELYSYTLPFEELVGTIKKVKKNPEDVSKIQNHVIYLVFDVVDQNKTFKERLNILQKDIIDVCGRDIVLVQTKMCDKKEDIQQHYMEAMEKGMEGLVLRNSNGMYRPKYRSLHVQKLKSFESEEFKVVGFTEGTGSDSGTIIFVCEIPSGKTFSARPRGTILERKAMFVNGKEFIGKKITIRYQELTSAGIPRFPVALAVDREHT